jgi:hypothetical protein
MQANTGMKPNSAAPEAILHPGSRRLFSYWNGLRGTRGAPGRQEIELRALAPILPWLGIVERQARPRRHRWRLAGTGIGRLWGNGLTGAAVAADWPEVYRSALVRALDGVCERRQPFVARLKAVSAEGEALGIELFAAPVEAESSAAVQTLCSVLPFRDPAWLGHVPLTGVELSTLTAIWLGPLPDEISRLQGFGPAASRLKLIRGGRSD